MEWEKRLKQSLEYDLGPEIISLLSDPEVIEIMLNPDGKLWVERMGEPMKEAGFIADFKAEAAIGTLAASLNTTITAQNPVLEGELLIDGSRFEAMIPPVVAGPTFTIRKKASKVFSLQEYVEQGIMTQAQREVIASAVAARKNILVVGGTGTGKTTLTNGIIHHIVAVSPGDRIIIIEDTGELQCTAKNSCIMRAVDHCSMTKLIKATMRMRPDRIIVGEVRDGAALDLLKVWNTGHPGGVATVHANSAPAGLTRIEHLVREVTQAPMQAFIAEVIDLVVSIEKTPLGRRIREIIEVTSFDGRNYIFKIQKEKKC